MEKHVLQIEFYATADNAYEFMEFVAYFAHRNRGLSDPSVRMSQVVDPPK